MLSHVVVDALEKDGKRLEQFRNKLIADGNGIKYYDELNILSSMLGKIEAIIQLSRDGKI